MKMRSVIIIFLILFTACDDKLSWINPPVPVPETKTPVISSMTPDTGTAGTEVTITGTNFSAEISGNTVLVNGVEATITEASATQIKFTIPAGTTGPVVITSNGKQAESQPVFTYL